MHARSRGLTPPVGVGGLITLALGSEVGSLVGPRYRHLRNGEMMPPCGSQGYSTGSPSNWCPFTVSFLGEGSLTRIDYRKRIGTLILTALLEDLVHLVVPSHPVP